MGWFTNLWRPWNFHYHRHLVRPKDRFEGWYFKVVDAGGAQPMAFIPGVFLGRRDPHAFIQVLDGRAGSSWVVRFPVSAFHASTEELDVSIGGSRFSRHGITLDLHEEDRHLTGEIGFGEWSPWPVTTLAPGVMGPFSFLPFMECFHGILSFDHVVRGALRFDGRETSYDGGGGYIEKDWGQSFPRAYVWTQSNRFEVPGVSVSASVAHIPMLGTSFRGFLGGVLHEGRLHRFTTYNGSRVEAIELTETRLRLVLRSPSHRVEIEASRAEGALLMAPYEGQMLERVAETMASTVDLRLSELAGDTTLFEGRGRSGCLEAQGQLDLILGG